jgi:hypothetical protein
MRPIKSTIHPDHDVVPEIVIIYISSRVIGQDGQALLHQRHVLGRVVDEEVDVLGESARAVGEDGNPPDQHVARPGGVQGAAEADEVFRFWCSCVRSSILVIHASASSKLENR